MKLLRLVFLIQLSCSIALGATDDPSTFAFSTQLKPKFEAKYYVEQGLNYFDTLDSYVTKVSKPKYSENVIRWEWHPWLKLTGYKRWMMPIDEIPKLYPTKVTNRDCRFFEIQPFCRCRVWFEYLGLKTPVKIYEEFTFNDFGEMTFIEAWTDVGGADPWGEKGSIHRLSTRVPGLGTPHGLVTENDRQLKHLATKDSDVKDLLQRLESPIFYWFKELFRSIGEFL